ncbi:MAG: 2-hydroxyacid dehydrogenase [Dehalococcoidia bacterium]
MSKPRAFLATTVPDHVRQMLEAACELRVFEGPGRRCSREQFERVLPEVDGVLTSNGAHIDHELIDAAPNLKVVSNFGVGYDNVDIPYATAHGLLVCNTPGVLSDAVADLTYGFMICLARGIVTSDQHAKGGHWSRGVTLPLGRDLRNSTLGILGLGRIGHVVAYRAAAFGMNVIYYDPIRDPIAEENGLAEYRERDDIFREADFLTVHVFLDPTTRRHVGAREFGLMKRTAYLINTSRGGVIDQPALAEALRSGTIAGAALDVLEQEPPDESDPILAAPNLIVAPHIGSATAETRQAMAELSARNLIAAISGGTPEAMVNPEALEVRRKRVAVHGDARA